jgi:hypothetical protein
VGVVSCGVDSLSEVIIQGRIYDRESSGEGRLFFPKSSQSVEG